MESFLNDSETVLLNDGSPTYLNTGTGNFSSIDLSISSPALAVQFSFHVLDDQYGSDHFPIVLRTGVSRVRHFRPPRWRLKDANWELFRSSVRFLNPVENVDEEVSRITSSILAAADGSIPKSGGPMARTLVPWWTREIDAAIKEKKRSLNRFKRYPTQLNMIEFKRARAKARRLIVLAKTRSWEAYISSVTSETDF